MKKNIIALAVAAAIAAPAAAVADTTLYSKIHASYDFFGGDTADNADYSLASNSSRIGIKGKEAISDNLSVIYQWENELDWGATKGKGLKSSDTRDTYVGFAGGGGTLYVGIHDTPLKEVRSKYDLFGDTVGDARSILRGRAVQTTGNDWDQRYNNTLAYVTPDLGGFQAKVSYISDTKALNNETDAYSASAGYEIGGFGIIAGYERHNREEVAGEEGDQSSYRVAAQFKIAGFKVMGLYQGVENVNYLTESQARAAGTLGGDMDMYGAGAAYSFGKSTIKAHYFTASDVESRDGTGADLWAVGYDYKLSKQTKVYAAFANMSNDRAIAEYAVGYKSGHGQTVPNDGTNGNDNNAFSLGVVHKF